MNSALTNWGIIKSKLDALYAAQNVDSTQLQVVKSNLDLFLKGVPLQLHFSYDPFQRKINDILTTGLFTIFSNTKDSDLKEKSKQTVKNSLDPALNPSLTQQIVTSYNKNNNSFPIAEITDEVRLVLKRTFNYYFDLLWNQWLAQRVGPNNTYIKTGFQPLVYHVVSGASGKKSNGGFPYFWNQTNKPKKQSKAPQPELSKIITYVYGSKDTSRMNSFNTANKEIVDYLRKVGVNIKLCKVFDFVVGSMLDNNEITNMDKLFRNETDVSLSFQQLKRNAVSSNIDQIYQEHGLNLPPFNTWVTSDLNKGPSDRGQLQPEPPEVGLDDKGHVGKIKYDKYGNKSYQQLQEIRTIVRASLRNMFHLTSL